MKTVAAEPKAYRIVFDYFTTQIYNGTFKIGSRLPPEREIAEHLGVSRNSTREAIRMLEMMGFVESLQGSGNYIRCKPLNYMAEALNMTMVLQETSCEDLLRTHQALEREAVHLAVSGATEKDLSELQDLLNLLEQPQAPESLLALDARFRQALVNASHSDILSYLLPLTEHLMNSRTDGLWRKLLMDPKLFSTLMSLRHSLCQGLCQHSSGQVEQALSQYFSMLEQRIAAPAV